MVIQSVTNYVLTMKTVHTDYVAKKKKNINIIN